MNSRAVRNERRDGATPASLTAVIAERMKALRGDVRLSGPALAVEMNKQGVPWNRTTVAKLETGRRESVTVPELVALATVLRVPVTALLPDQGCSTCYENPPPGFTCNACGKGIAAAAGRGTQVPQE